MKLQNTKDLYSKDSIGDSETMKRYIAWFDNYRVNPLLSYFTKEDIAYIHKLAKSPYMHNNIHEMYKLLGELMLKRGFRLIGGGTNRRAYECIYDNRIVAKVATDNVGFISNLKEFTNQNVLKPFCNKIFEVSPCGSLAIIENVVPIKTIEEFQKYAPEIFDILYFKLRNNSIAMDDIGCRSMKNWGYRSGFGPVLLDYPSMYVADPKKRLCKNILGDRLCCGSLDYDEGFNVIVCSECGKTYLASTLSKPQGEEITNLLDAVGYNKKSKGEFKKMAIRIVNKETGAVEKEFNTSNKSRNIDPSKSNFDVNAFVQHNYAAKKKKIGIHIVPKKEAESEDSSSTVEVKDEVNNDGVIKVTNEKKVMNVTIVPSKEPDESNTITINKPVIATEVIEPSSENESCFEKFEKKFKKYNSLSNKYSAADLAKAVSENITEGNALVSEFEARKIYRDLSVATMIGNKAGDADIDMSSLISAKNTEINATIRKLLNGTAYDDNDMFTPFFRVINNVKNSKRFFTTIVSFWRAFIESYSNEFDENPEYMAYTFNTDIYDKYHDIVNLALADYVQNIRGSAQNGIFTYTSENIFNIIYSGMEDMKKLQETSSATKQTTVVIGRSSASQDTVDCSISEEKINEDMAKIQTNSMYGMTGTSIVDDLYIVEGEQTVSTGKNNRAARRANKKNHDNYYNDNNNKGKGKYKKGKRR